MSNQELIAAYEKTRSVWRAGKEVGLAGQSVHERLVALGIPLSMKKWTSAEDDEMRALIENGCQLAEVARRLGRTYSATATRASDLGMHNNRRVRSNRKLPRGAGFDKVTVRKHMKQLAASPRSFTQYCRTNRLAVEVLSRALETHCPDDWEAYKRAHSDLPSANCEYCGREFVPSSSRQRFCTRKCGDQSRIDLSYFGGRRRETIGLSEGICQICGRQRESRIASHHVVGKGNDPDNSFLVALCNGCHDLVSRLGARPWVNDPEIVESLLSFAWMRYFGPAIAATDGAGVRISVDIEPLVTDAEGEEVSWNPGVTA